ncbi:MAG: hypothetical protein QGH83_04295 [Candidatus Pacebacteria bacterium]|nr:hypothetical protein [Candidatus Paceibacterota bacterium]
MEPIDVYLMYCALKAHFSRSNYDFHKYGGKTKISRDSFWKRKDKYFFVKLTKKLDDNNSIQDYLLSNFVKDRKGYIANFNDENYEAWKDRRTNFYNIFSNELKPLVKDFEPLFQIKNNNHPKLLKEFLGDRVSLETLIILDELVSFSKNWDKELKEDIVWPDLKKMMKNYKGFLTIDRNRCRIKLLELIEEFK